MRPINFHDIDEMLLNIGMRFMETLLVAIELCAAVLVFIASFVLMQGSVVLGCLNLGISTCLAIIAIVTIVDIVRDVLDI